MTYTNRKKKKPTKVALKKERNKANAAGDEEWDEFYAQLIEYEYEHGTCQVPIDYIVTTDDSRQLALGAWLQVQGTRLTDYAKSKPQWYSDIMDLIETGKLWFDADSKRTSPVDVSFVSLVSSSKRMTSTTTNATPSTKATKSTSSKAAPPAQSRDYAVDIDSSDDGSENSMTQDLKRSRTDSMTSAKSQPSAKQSAPTLSTLVDQKKTSQPSRLSTVTIPVIPEVGSKRRAVSATPHGDKVTSKRKASTTHKRRKAYKDSSEDESEPSSNSESETSEFVEELMDWQTYEEQDIEPEPAPQKKLSTTVSAPDRSRINTRASSAKSTSSTTTISASAKPSAIAAALNKEREKDAARKKVDQPASHNKSEPTLKSSNQPTRSSVKSKSTSSSDIGAFLSNIPVPSVPVIPSASASVPVSAGNNETGLIRPEQFIATATGPLSPRRTMSKPEPVLAPVPTPPPLPVLTSRTPSSNGTSGPRNTTTSTTSSSVTQLTRTSVPSIRSGAMPHISSAPVADAGSAAAHESPRSDVSVAGSDPSLAQTTSAFTTENVTTPTTAKSDYPSPRDTYSGVDTKKRSSISEYKQAGSFTTSSSALPYGLLSLGKVQSKDSPRTATGTASESSSPVPNLLPNDTEADEKEMESENNDDLEDEEDIDKLCSAIYWRRFGRPEIDPCKKNPHENIVDSEPVNANSDDEDSDSEEDSEEEEKQQENTWYTIEQRKESHRLFLKIRKALGLPDNADPHEYENVEYIPIKFLDDNYNDQGELEESTIVEKNDSNVEAIDEGFRNNVKHNSCQAIVSTPPVSTVLDSACTTGATTMTTLTTDNPVATTTNAVTDFSKFVVNTEDSEDESVASDQDSNNGTKLPREEGDYVEPNAEFVAFAYTRSTTGPKHPMLGIGMVCNADNDTSGGLYLIVMVPEAEMANDPVRAEYRMDPDEFITVQRQLVLARDLSFVDGGRGGVFDAPSQAKIQAVLNTYRNLKFDTYFM